MKNNKHKQEKSIDQGSKLPELAVEIKKQLGEAAGVLKRSLEFYRKAGAALITAQKELDPKKGRGGMAWPAWLKQEIGIEKRVAQFYMRLARHWDKVINHPAFRMDLNYAAALKLIQPILAAKRNNNAIAGRIGPAQSESPQSEPRSLDQAVKSEAVQSDIPAQQEGAQARQEVTADDQPSDGEPHILPSEPGEAVAKSVVNATAQVIGEADLVITPCDGYSLGQVLSMVAAGEAAVQEQSKTIIKPNAEVIATFDATLRTTWKLTNLAAVALAA